MPTKATQQEKYTAAVIGVGAVRQSGAKGGSHGIGYTHAEMFRRNPQVRLVAAADINAENLKAFQEKCAVADGFADYNEMLREVKPDLVSIGTYVGLHRAIVTDAARAGVKGVVCEKPFLASPADAAAVRQVAADSGLKLVVTHLRRYSPTFQRARELYTNGTVGKPLMCIAGLEGWDLSEWGSHWLDMFRFFHNDQPVKWVFGQARVRALRGYGHAMEDHGVAYFEFEGGGKALLDGGRGLEGAALMVLVGTEGTIRVMGEDELVIESAAGRQVEPAALPPAPWTKLKSSQPFHAWYYMWDLLLADLIKWLEGGPEPMIGLTNTLKTSELNLAAYLSALTGDRVDLPLNSELLAINEWPVELLARRRQ